MTVPVDSTRHDQASGCVEDDVAAIDPRGELGHDPVSDPHVTLDDFGVRDDLASPDHNVKVGHASTDQSGTDG